MKRVRFLDQYGYYDYILIVKSLSRLYIFQSVAEAEDDETANKFISSIRIEQRSLIPTENDEKLATERPAELYNPRINDNQVGKADAGDSKTTSIGNGSGSGKAGPSPSSVVPVSTTGQNTNVKMISTPRGQYTDDARFYEIGGVVRLRVTLLSSGEVGSVAPLNHLPFGLTESAINAAKSIRFEPALRDGKPVNIAKIIEYNFYIY